MGAQPVAERLLERLRVLGLNIPDGARVLKSYPGTGWDLVTADNDYLRIGSDLSPTVLMREDRLVAACTTWSGLTRVLRWRPAWDDADPTTFGLLLIEPQVVHAGAR